jgi:adenylate kinase family enzyme
MKLHLFGASGSGTTTLGRALAERLAHPFFDVDDYYWLPTTPTFTKKRERSERIDLLRRTLGEQWILAGSMCGWGEELLGDLDLAIFLEAPTAIRLQRLRARELERNIATDRIEAFLRWAAEYDSGGMAVRSKRVHEALIARLSCRVLRLDGTEPVAANVERVHPGPPT